MSWVAASRPEGLGDGGGKPPLILGQAQKGHYAEPSHVSVNAPWLSYGWLGGIAKGSSLDDGGFLVRGTIPKARGLEAATRPHHD